MRAMMPENDTVDLEERQIDARVISSLFVEAPAPVRLGRYVILGRLGQGGMGVVYSAFDDTLDRKVAIKVMRRRLDPETRHRAIREAQALARLTHPNVVAVYDVNLDDGVWIAMEFVSGDTLRAWARDRRRSWREVLRVLQQVACGVVAAHAVGLVHRDLKPENVMIASDGRVRVLDFGLAHGRGAGVTPTDVVTEPRVDVDTGVVTGALTLQLTPSNVLQGTPAYLSPEQWLGESADAVSDQFSWCVMAWELLFDERPFPGETTAELRSNVLAGALRTPGKSRVVPRWLRRLIERGLHVDRALRWPGMAELERALSADPSRRLWAGGALLTTAAAVGIGVGYTQWQHQEDVRACAHQGDTIDEVWNEEARGRLQERILGTGLVNAATTFEKTIPWIDEYVDAWRTVRVDVCHAGTITKEWSAASLAKAEACLEERRISLEGALEVLSHPVPDVDGGSLLSGAVAVVSRLPSVADCRNVLRLESQPGVPTDRAVRDEIVRVRGLLARAGALDLAGSYRAGLTVVEEASQAAAELAWEPLQAAAALRQGSLHHHLGDHAVAESAYLDAFFTAGRAGADTTMVDAANALALFLGSTLDRHHEGRIWARIAGMALDRMLVPASDLRRAQMHMVMGHIDYDTGEHESALVNHRASLAIRTEILGESHPDVSWSLSGIAMNLRRTGKPDEALRLFEQALAIKEATLGSMHQKVGLDLINLGVVYTERGERDRAIETYERAARILTTVLGETYEDAAILHSNLAGTYEAKGDHEKALQHARHALDVGERTLGPDNSRMAACHQTMANIYFNTKDFDKALVHQERVREIRVAVFGEDHESVAFALSGLANIYSEQGALEKALTLQQHTLAMLRKRLPEKHDEIAKSLHGLGDIQLRMGALEQALGSEQRALEIWEATLGPDNPELVYALVNLGSIYIEMGRSEHARAPLERAVALCERISTDPVDLASARFVLARALWSDALERATSRRLATLALDAFSAAGAIAAKERQEVQAWLNSHSGGAPSAPE
jgi:tetratricopeptide (TPR) repeat protein/predicted Ser/Thr protein kinase